jgi:hypothetical protein
MILPRRIAQFAVAFFAVAIFIAALVVGSSYNPTPTNNSGGGPGSSYPGWHQSASYSHPLFTYGPDGS